VPFLRRSCGNPLEKLGQAAINAASSLLSEQNRTTLLIAQAVLPSFVVKYPIKHPGPKCAELHLNKCISFVPQLAHFQVQSAPELRVSNNVGPIAWGFQQVSPRYGVLLLDALVSNSVQLLQLARRNLRPESGQQRPGCESPIRVNQPPLAKAPLGSSGERFSAERAVREGFEAQRDCRDAVLGDASRWTVIGSPGTHGTEMTSNCNPLSDGVLPKGQFVTVSASKVTDRCSLSNSQGVHSC
jgi:hypothetical protein